MQTPKIKTKATVFFVLGGRGAGKGTVCQKLVDQHGFVHLSVGDLLRREKNYGGKNAEVISKYIKAGKNVPVVITVNLIKKAMEKEGLEKKKFLIDGFPPDLENYHEWDEVMGDIADVKFVLYMHCSEAIMLERIKERAGRAIMARESPRIDDNVETAQKRFKAFKEETIPLVNKIYEPIRKVKHINANSSQGKVFADVLLAF